MKQVNGRDVAKAAGVSQSTVSRVMNSDARIGHDTRCRVLAAARKLGYDMCPASGRWSVGVLLGFPARDANGYYAELFAAVFQEIEKRGLHLEAIWKKFNMENEPRPIRGVLILSNPEPQTLTQYYPLPSVWINGKSDHLHNICSCNVDSKASLNLAIRHLRGLGHRDIRFLSLEGRVAEEKKLTHRWQSFLELMRDYGIESPERQGIFPDSRSFDALLQAVRHAVNDGCTAFICVNSRYTLQLNAALHTLRISVPDDVSVIDWEFDGVSAYLDPPRTALAVNFAGFARSALDMLTTMIEKHTTPRTVWSPPLSSAAKAAPLLAQFSRHEKTRSQSKKKPLLRAAFLRNVNQPLRLLSLPRLRNPS